MWCTQLLQHCCQYAIHVTGHGTDYVSGPYNVIVFAGTTTASFDVPIINDSILESDEDFILTINPSTLPSDVSVGSYDNTVVTITNDDSK